MATGWADAAGSGLAACLAPRTVAVIGTGRHGGVGAEIFANLAATYLGRVFPVNPHAAFIGGRPCYRSAAAIGEAIDLAVIAVPADCVDAAVDDCIAAGVRAVIVISSGFGETGDAGRHHEALLIGKARRAGIRLLGPNCVGLVNADPALRMNASLASAMPAAGPIAIASQSGALGLALLDAAAASGIGVSTFVSMGNSADVSFADLLDYWEDDPRTRVILLYAEQLGDPGRLVASARRVSHTKPIVALKAGRSSAGARAAASHTGALAAGDVLVDAAFRAGGIVRVDTIDELLDTAALLAAQPLPRGRRLAILTNAGGPAILAADACDSTGLDVAALSPQTAAALRALLPPQASVADPVDMIATATPADYARAVPLLLADSGVDALLTICIPLRGTDTREVARSVAGAAAGSPKPVAATFFGAADTARLLAPVPSFPFPEDAVRALGRAAACAERRRDADPPPTDAALAARAREVLSEAAIDAEGWVDAATASALVAAAGVTVAPTRAVVSRHGAVTAAGELGYPIVLKGTGPALLHKTEARAVVCDLRDETEMLQAFTDLESRRDVERILVQPMIRGGVEMFIGAVRDPAFGPVITCGSGGVLVELLRDVSTRLAPVTAASAADMVGRLRGAARLRGFRGGPVLDEHAYASAVERVGALVQACPEIAELDLNPVIVQEHGIAVVDVRLRRAAPDGTPLACSGSRRPEEALT